MKQAIQIRLVRDPGLPALLYQKAQKPMLTWRTDGTDVWGAMPADGEQWRFLCSLEPPKSCVLPMARERVA